MRSEDVILQTIETETQQKSTDTSAKKFYVTGTQPLRHRWKKCVDKGDFVQSNFDFEKGVPMIYVNFIIIVSIVAE
jgi:hypothetical protein